MDQPTPRTNALPEEYLTITEVADRLKVKPKTVKNKMAAGIFKKGVHFFSPPGLGPRFKWSVVVEWLESTQQEPTDETLDDIPMARDYLLGKPSQACPLHSKQGNSVRSFGA